MRKCVDMFKRANLHKLNDYFIPLSSRAQRGMYFCRIAKNSNEVTAFIKNYYDTARRGGVVIDGRIPNPTPQNLEYFDEMMGNDFQLDQNFLSVKLKKWLPRMSDTQRETVVTAIFSTLQDMQKNGKNENMLRNAYMKYMCWLYYKFERIVNQLGGETPPKILYDGTISNYELQLLVVLSRAGADIVLLEREGDDAYIQLDAKSEYSQLYQEATMTAFPDYFNLKWIQSEMVKQVNRQRLYGTLPSVQNCTNAWMQKAELAQVLTPVRNRGTDDTFFYNSFLIQYGMEEKLTYSNDLFAFYKNLKNEQRKICVVNKEIPVPTMEEIATIKRGNYANIDQMVLDLSQNIQYSANIELQRLMIKSFVDVLLEESEKQNANVLKLTNKAVYLLCWLKRYQKILFQNWKMPEISVFILFGNCASENEKLFLQLLSKLPIDVLILLPNLNVGTVMQAQNLLEIKYEFSISMEEFPVEQAQMRVSTAAFQAERDLDELMYQDTGLYRNQQYAKAETVTLQTMYEEIEILWDQELKYRPSFSTDNDVVTLPVLLGKVCGVKDGQVAPYWQAIKKMVTPDTLLITQIPWISSLDENPMKPYTTQFLKNGKLLKNKIKEHKAYPYSILRQEMQEYLLERLQVLLDEKIIQGTYENGTEYTIIATILHLDKDILRMIQKFDFTKKNPKLILINTTEKIISLEDSIVIAFLNLVGFDILFFVPTGYQCIEKYFHTRFVHEYQIGEYMYDLSIPNLNGVQDKGFNSIKRLFGRSGQLWR